MVDVQSNGRMVVGVVKIPDELSASTVDDFRRELATLISPASKVQNYVIDMSDVDMIDSSGIGALLSLASKIRDLGGDIKISCLQTGPKRVFEIIRAHRHFEIFDNLEIAINSY
ncbi:anti-sigma factor antagonist [Verrucomicrobia bacterium S94]|nr:anti-sigma factor antagonist [Verrucomicrobia bacterium S94]